MRTTASNSTPAVAARVTLTVRGVVPSLSAVTPVIENVSSPVRPSDSAVSPLGELQRQHAHADQVGAVDPLVGLGDDGLDAEQRGALGRPVARRAGAVLLAGQDDQRDAGGVVVLRRPRRSIVTVAVGR